MSTLTKTVKPQQLANGLITCACSKSLLDSTDFYNMLETFCKTVSTSGPAYNLFINQYFNDEGYADIWRIPHLMIDSLSQNIKLHKVLENAEFRSMFQQFLADLYNYCFMSLQPHLLDAPDAANFENSVLELKSRQQFVYNLMGTFAKVMENIQNYN